MKGVQERMTSKAKLLFDRFAERPIAYYPVYAKICGGITAGLLLSQLVYWGRVSKWREFYKTGRELREEISMGRHEFLSAKKKIRTLGFALTRVKNYPPVTYYKVMVDKIIEAISNCPDTKQSVSESQTNGVRKPDNIHTENTTEKIYIVFKFWNSQKIIQHREFEKFKPHIQAKLKSYTMEEINQAIKNYKEILDSPDHFFSYRWSLDQFLSRKNGLDRFLDREAVMREFIKDSNGNGNGYRNQAEINSASSGKLVL